MTNAIAVYVHEWTRDRPRMADFKCRLDCGFAPEQCLKMLDEHSIHFNFFAAATPFGDDNDCVIAALGSSPRLRGRLIVNQNVERHAPDPMNSNAAACRH